MNVTHISEDDLILDDVSDGSDEGDLIPLASSRRDAFDAKRKRAFVKALARGDTLTAAARAVRVSIRTVYNHQETDTRFAAACRAAVEVNAPVLELAAFERAVTGIEEDVISYGKIIATRIKRSDALLQTLLKGSNPAKYGARAGFGRVAPAASDKAREAPRKNGRVFGPKPMSEEELRASLLKSLKAFGARVSAEGLASGEYTLDAETNTRVPRGWALVRAADPDPAADPANGGDV